MSQTKRFPQLISCAVFFFLLTSIQAQVGINTISPNSTLDVSSPKTNSGSFDSSKITGMQAPRLQLSELANITATYGANQKGVIIYITDVTGGNTLGQRANIEATGYYYFDGSLWQKLASDKTDDAWEDDPTNSQIKLATKSDGSNRDANTDFVAKDNGQVSIGSETIHSSALFSINASNQGVLFPNVALINNTDQFTIANPATGLLVYNTGTAGLDYIGYVYWDGVEWKAFAENPTIDGTITSLACHSAKLESPTYISGNAYLGTLTVPYFGGNGGIYPSATIGPINGLTATLTEGFFNYGPGNLIYTIEGTPTETSPTPTDFPLNIGGQSCTVRTGDKIPTQFAQVTFTGYGPGPSVPGGTQYYTNAYGTDCIIEPGSKNVARVKRLGQGIFRIDFVEPFEDTNYIIGGYATEGIAFNADNTQPSIYVPKSVRDHPNNSLSVAIIADTDTNPGNAGGLDPMVREIKEPGYNPAAGAYGWSVDAKYRTHFYLIEGVGNYPLQAASLSILR